MSKKEYLYDYAEIIFRPDCGDKFRIDFSDNYNTFGTLINRHGTEFPAVASEPGGRVFDGTHMTAWCDHAFATFEYSGGSGKFEYSYGDKKWRKIGGD